MKWAGKGGTAHWYGLRLALDHGGRERLYLVNGEPGVWACAQSGVPAVCTCAGEGTPPTADLMRELREAGVERVVVVFDLDGPGREGAPEAVEALQAGGVEAVALELPADLGHGGDVDDLHRRTGDDGLAAALAALPTLPSNAVTVQTCAPEEQARPEPDLAVLGGYRRPAPPFPLETLPHRWAKWTEAAAEGSGAPVAYSACALLAFAAGAIGNAARVSPWPGWSEPAVLWLALVGESSDGKSPALDPLRMAVDRLEAGWAEPFEGAHDEWVAAAVVAKAKRMQWEPAVQAAVKEPMSPPQCRPAASPAGAWPPPAEGE